MKINSVTVKSPSSVITSLQNIGSRVDRNAAGSAVMDRIGQKKRLEIVWNVLTPAELNVILTNSAAAFFTVEHEGTATYYAENIEYAKHRTVYVDVKMELMER